MEDDKYKIYTHFNTERNELFFAKKILLVEGDSDKILFSTLAEEKWDLNLDNKGVSVVECGGKSGVIYFIGVCRLLGITEFFAVWDQDDDKEDAFDQLKFALEEGSGLEIPENLETFLNLSANNKNKVQKAYEWATTTDQIPAEFDIIKRFLTSDETSISQIESETETNITIDNELIS
ncbi:MAG: ATP-dependent endonuclease [Candidatus Dojkabacteria bacterium]